MKAVFLIAALGLIASVGVHISTYLGINPGRVFSPIWALHFLPALVWLSALVLTGNFSKIFSRRDFLTFATENAPSWMRTLCTLVYYYTLINLLIIIIAEDLPSEIDGQRALHSQGEIIRELTEEENDRQEAYAIRAFSGLWIIVYLGGITLLYSGMKDPSKTKLHGRRGVNNPG